MLFNHIFNIDGQRNVVEP